ncbi:MAG TPA: hypothetical protein VJ377_08770 [Dehalococcoidales bacterium]|nr:hypothetical protein [Dehalococcoidales bacterium]
MVNKNPYTWSGLGLLIAGVLVSLSAYAVFHLTWLTALGISLLIISVILLALSKAVPELPPEVCALLLETGVDNIAALIEELGVRTRAIYLPSSLSGDRPRAFIPLRHNGTQPKITATLPQRLITRYGTDPEDVGLLVATIGSAAVGLLESKPAATEESLEESLNALFAGRLGIADGASVICRENVIDIEIRKPRMKNGAAWSHRCLGRPLASMVASIAAEAWDRPVTIRREEQSNGKYRVALEVLG